jgi:response regulator RpfG family c-di-GMP phosphodiesterase
MNDTILFVDDDVHVLSALQRSLYRSHQIEIATSAKDALNAIKQGAYAVIVSDLRMPGMNGTELLARVKQLAPDTVRILLTGQADLEAAIAAVNEGNVFRFLTKPCPRDLLCKTLDAALEQHRLQVAEEEVLRETLTGTVAILVQVLSAIQPLAFGRASRIRRYVRLVAAEMGLEKSWQLDAAAMLSQLGWISVDPKILQKYYEGRELSEVERRHLLDHASAGCNLLNQVPRLGALSQIIERQHQEWRSGLDSEPEAYLIGMGAQILGASLEFDRLVGAGRSADDALAVMRRAGNEFHPDVLAVLECLKDVLPVAAGAVDLSPEYTPLAPEQLIFRPLAEEVLRSMRS